MLSGPNLRPWPPLAAVSSAARNTSPGGDPPETTYVSHSIQLSTQLTPSPPKRENRASHDPVFPFGGAVQSHGRPCNDMPPRLAAGNPPSPRKGAGPASKAVVDTHGFPRTRAENQELVTPRGLPHGAKLFCPNRNETRRPTDADPRNCVRLRFSRSRGLPRHDADSELAEFDVAVLTGPGATDRTLRRVCIAVAR